MEIARQEDISPADAMLSLVRTAVGRSVYVDRVLTRIMEEHVRDGGDPLDPPPLAARWMTESRSERKLAASTAKAAIDAGAMAAIAHRLDLAGGLVADAVAAALDSLGLDSDDRMKALGAAQDRLLKEDG